MEKSSSESVVLNQASMRNQDEDAALYTTTPHAPDTTKEGLETSTDVTTTSIEADGGYLTGLKLFLAMLSMTTVGFLLLLDVSIVATAIPRITTDFNSLNDIGWYGAAYVLTNCACQPLSGQIYNNFNVKWAFLTFFAIFEAGSAICGAASSSNMLIVGRAITGVGGAGLMNGAFNIIHGCAPLPKQPMLVGILVAVAQFGIVLGPLIGGALTQYASWRWCFYINLPCGGLASLLFLFTKIPQSRRKHQTLFTSLRNLDLIGFVFFAPAVIQLILALQWGGVNYAWNSATIIGLFCGAVGTLVIFLFWEHHMGEEAMIPLSLT